MKKGILGNENASYTFILLNDTMNRGHQGTRWNFQLDPDPSSSITKLYRSKKF